MSHHTESTTPETRRIEPEVPTVGILSIPWGVGAASSTVSQGDISWSNLVVKTVSDGGSKAYYAVLSDFDLAAVMKPGQESPEETGFERTGTKPFMATDLLNESNGTSRRLGRHDLESCIWCLVWYCKPEEVWKNGSFFENYHYKLSCALANRATPLEAIRKGANSLWHPTLRLVKAWTDMLWSLDLDLKTGGKTDGDNMRLVHSIFPYPERRDKKDWDLMWMDWKVSTVDSVLNNETGENEGKKK